MITLEGTIEEIVYANDVNGYLVCEMKSGSEYIIAVGYMPFTGVGETLRLSGSWGMHPDYGKQFKVDMYEKILPDTNEAIYKYLASGVIKGIGPVIAAKIIEKFEETTLDIIRFNPQKLFEIKGISLEKAIKIGQAFEEQTELRQVIMFFQEYGISSNYASKIYKVFGKDTIEQIKKNPYKLADEKIGIGFKTADRIARLIGIESYSKYRLCSGIKYILSQASFNGHTFVLESRLIELSSELLEIDIDNINDAIVTLTLDKSIFVERKSEENRIYLSALYNAEVNVCKKLGTLTAICFNSDDKVINSNIDRIEKSENISLAAMQRLAIVEAMQNGVLVITGGPGTGKTTIIKSILRLLIEEGYNVALTAPTGRAAKRMSEATGYEAKTIHRLLEIGYSGEDEEPIFSRGEENPIDANVVIVDETSMVDIMIMSYLVKALEPGTRLILVGDVDQLPSVGAGNVLRDIINSKVIKIVKLKEIFRQAQESMITVNAHRINNGEHPYLNVKDKDFYFMSRKNSNDIIEAIVSLCSKRLPETYSVDPIRHIQVLTPTRKGDVGVSNLNIELQKILNPQKENSKQKSVKGFNFRVGDRIMQTKNNYNLKWSKVGEKDIEGSGVFNGDMGIILEINNEDQRLLVLFDDDKEVFYDYMILDEIEPAYAITIHKSQGSEFPVVVIPLYYGPKILLTRNLLYTAITRAKKLVVLVGSEEVLYEMIENKREHQRNSNLFEKLNNYLGEKISD